MKNLKILIILMWVNLAFSQGYKRPQINAEKIANSSVNDTEFQYINSLTSNAQTQLNAKVDKVSGKALTTNDFTDVLKNKLDGITISDKVDKDGDTMTGTLTAPNLIGNWNGKEVSDFEPAITFSGSAGTLSDSKGSYINLNFGSTTSLTIPTGLTKRKWLISTTSSLVNFVGASGVTINVIANNRATSLAIGDEDSIGQSATLIRVSGDTYNLIK